MENMIDINTIVKNAKSACKDGDLAFTRLYSGLKLTDIKEVIGVVDGGWGKSGYQVYYISDRIDIDQIVKSYEVNFL